VTAAANRYLIGAQVLGGAFEEDETDDPDAQLALQAASEISSALEQQMTSFDNPDGGRTVDGGGSPGAFAPPAREDEEADENANPPPSYLPSELDEVSDEEWTRWVSAMKVADLTTVSDNGSLGMFAMKPRRLADLGLMSNVVKTPRKKGATWDGDWVPPMTQDHFLGNASIQYRVLAASTRLYSDALADGTIAIPPGLDISLSGALALLHRCGPQALANWVDGDKRLPASVALLEKANELF
jgi:hypothetical protein